MPNTTPPGSQSRSDFTLPKDLLKSPRASFKDSPQDSSGRESPMSSGAPSPLLLAQSELTPLNSRYEDSALYSDSDAGSQSSLHPLRDLDAKPHKRSTSRRRQSDSDKSAKSYRSSSGQREKVTQRTKVFRNLLMLEDSLRDQLREQKALRQKFTAFLAGLAGVGGFTIYLLYFTNAQMSSFLEWTLKFAALFILVTLVLFHLSGEYKRTIVIPRRFFNSTNKGIRQMNLRLVKVDVSYSDQVMDSARLLLRVAHSVCVVIYSYSGFIKRTSLGLWANRVLKKVEIRAQPRMGPTDFKLVLNPRTFNAEIREAWELYRDEFWAREGARKRHVNEEEKGKAKGEVLNKESLVEKHRKERKDRRKSRGDGVFSPELTPRST